MTESPFDRTNTSQSRNLDFEETPNENEPVSVRSRSIREQPVLRVETRRVTRTSDSSSSQPDSANGYVLILLPGPPWGEDWAAASAAAARVVRARKMRDTRNLPSDGGSETLPIPIRRLRPSRVLWLVNGRIEGRALVRVVDQLAAEGRPISLVHSHFYANGIGLPYLLSQRGIPYVITEHSTSLTFLNPEKEISSIGMKIAASVYGSASYVLPVAQSLANDIRRRGLPGNLKVIPNPVDTDVFVPLPRSSESRIVTTAWLTPVKRLDLLLRAVQEMVSAGSSVCLDIIGDGPSRASLVALAQSLGIADRVKFHGWVARSEIPSILGRGSVFALSSYAENLPVAMIEALSCGLPVVGPKIAGIPEIVDGAPGAVFEPGDQASLANSLRRWCNPSDRERQAARATALERYSIAVIGSQLSDIYRSATTR